ncbi:Gfo/Idh/MocA family protein [Occultella kanbiaonis]|uniref:Gfo/Idh/MocA family protein n=1 Tax=Occultella kanbiaonis TaxID=2675754 RepID=UPI0012B89BED|nr:Gfo/Idh/MocA family oxidoreductase [Occultella kanbiaonis]
MTLRIALVGAGAMGTIMARDVYPPVTEQVSVVAVVDRNHHRRAELAGGLGARAYGSLAQARAAEDLDGVDIRLPHAAHADLAVEALDAGLHVLVEKPLALTTEDCRRVAIAAARAGRVVAVAENYPHLRAVRAARAAIDDGTVGAVLALRSTRAYTLGDEWARPWRLGGEAASGLLWDQGTHHTSMLRVLGGEIVAVAAHRAGGAAGVETVTLDVRFASGLLGTSLYCWGTPARPVETEGLVLGTLAQLDIDVAYERPDGVARIVDGTGSRALCAAESYYESHRSIVVDWADAIATGRQPLVDLAAATADVRVVLAARESLARGGAEVPLGPPHLTDRSTA